MSKDELDKDLETPLNLQLPVSSMAVERGVKIVTRAANVTADPVEQDGFSFQTIAAVKKNSVWQEQGVEQGYQPEHKSPFWILPVFSIHMYINQTYAINA